MTEEEFLRLQSRCQPHKVFSTQWATFYPSDFGDTLLPDVRLLRANSTLIYDGADFFKTAQPLDAVQKINENKNILGVYVYTYPRGVEAENKKGSIRIGVNEIAVCVEVSQDDSIEVSFLFGNTFKQFLYNTIKINKLNISVTDLECKIYKTNILLFQKYFGGTFSNKSLIHFVLGTIGVSSELFLPLKVKILDKSAVFTPLGIINPVKKDIPVNNIKLEFETYNQDILNYTLIIKKNNKEIFKHEYLPTLVIRANQKAKQKTVTQNIIPGKYTAEWDGFDQEGKLDSTIFHGKIVLILRIKKEDDTDVDTSYNLYFQRAVHNATWLDIKIDRTTQKIDILLRLNLTEGKVKGLEECHDYMDGTGLVTICPWDDVPHSNINPIQPVITIKTKSFSDLVNLVIAGFRKYWSRNGNNPNAAIGQGIKIGTDLYLVSVDAVNSKEKALNSVPLLYNTNGGWERSGNTGGSYKDDTVADTLIMAIPDGIIQRIAYNVGHLKNGIWYYDNDAAAMEDFMFTAAHEIGHELLQAYAGTIYSWQHKGTSYFFPQDRRPIKPVIDPAIDGNHIDYMRTSKGEYYPYSKEIDIMKYYNGGSNPIDYNRAVAAEQDILGLIWLLKMRVKWE